MRNRVDCPECGKRARFVKSQYQKIGKWRIPEPVSELYYCFRCRLNFPVVAEIKAKKDDIMLIRSK